MSEKPHVAFLLQRCRASIATATTQDGLKIPAAKPCSEGGHSQHPQQPHQMCCLSYLQSRCHGTPMRYVLREKRDCLDKKNTEEKE